MLKRLTLSLTILLSGTLLLANPASASPETAEDWGARASALYGTTARFLADTNSLEDHALETAYLEGLAEFSVIAGRLAVWVDTSNVVKDFGCIYRGMAEEAELQIEALERAATQADAKIALTRIAAMLDDAQSIAVASAHSERTGNQTGTKGHCLASAIGLETYLEHPGASLNRRIHNPAE